jgi:phytoene synthase
MRSVYSSYRYCERLARRSAGNFYPAFRLLPLAQRRGMCALYAYMRICDDIVDEPGPTDYRAAALARWREQTLAALAGQPSHPIHPAFADTVSRFHIPHETLLAVLDGVAMDLTITRYETFADLYVYCQRVASAVGIGCIHIWGFRHRAALAHAEAAGIALQLTNILRDLQEDWSRGRVYIPQEDIARFRAEPPTWPERGESYRAMMQFQVQRARTYYQAAAGLSPWLDPPGRAIFRVILDTYRDLLELIASRDYDVFSQRIRLPGRRKAWLVLRALPVRLGWCS